MRHFVVSLKIDEGYVCYVKAIKLSLYVIIKQDLDLAIIESYSILFRYITLGKHNFVEQNYIFRRMPFRFLSRNRQREVYFKVPSLRRVMKLSSLLSSSRFGELR